MSTGYRIEKPYARRGEKIFSHVERVFDVDGHHHPPFLFSSFLVWFFVGDLSNWFSVVSQFSHGLLLCAGVCLSPHVRLLSFFSLTA